MEVVAALCELAGRPNVEIFLADTADIRVVGGHRERLQRCS